MQLPRTAARLAEAQLGVIARWQLKARVPEGRADRLLGYVTTADLKDERVLLGTVAAALTVRAHELGVDPPVLRRR